MADRIQVRGQPYLRFHCKCGQKQQSPEAEKVKCARCGKEHSADG